MANVLYLQMLIFCHNSYSQFRGCWFLQQLGPVLFEITDVNAKQYQLVNKNTFSTYNLMFLFMLFCNNKNQKRGKMMFKYKQLTKNYTKIKFSDIAFRFTLWTLQSLV